MSAGHGHTRENEKHPAELRKLMAMPSFQQMWARPFKVVTTKQIPDSAGYNVYGNLYFLDRDLVAALHNGKVVIPGMPVQQVMIALLTHERIEKCLLDADNPINTYPEAHEYATCGEHEYVRSVGGAVVRYEKGLAPIILFNQQKPLTDVPMDLQCSPILDEPDRNDGRILRDLRRMGIPDAFKITKKSVDYSKSTGVDQCGVCSHWLGGPQQDLSLCGVVNGAVRNTYWCRRFEAAGVRDGKQQTPGVQGGGSQDRPEPQDQEPGSGPGGGNAPGLPSGQESQPPAQPGQGVMA